MGRHNSIPTASARTNRSSVHGRRKGDPCGAARVHQLRTKRATDHAERFATEFVLKTLKKRLFSSPAAFLTTLERHEESLRSAKKKAVSKPKMSVLQREFDRMEEDYADDLEYDEATADALDSATRLFTELDEHEAALLKKMKKWAERARAQRDSKTNQLIQWLNETIKPKGKWSNERVIIFTEYRATQNWLQEVLATEGFSGGDRLLTMYGGMDSEQREAVKAAFQTSPDSVACESCWRPMLPLRVSTFRTSVRG